jgi:hypothetical protein
MDVWIFMLIWFRRRWLIIKGKWTILIQNLKSSCTRFSYFNFFNWCCLFELGDGFCVVGIEQALINKVSNQWIGFAVAVILMISLRTLIFLTNFFVLNWL